jgi:NADH-quinone oxidoreductase subunit N
MVAAVVAAYLYLRIMVSMWLESSEAHKQVNQSASSGATIAISVTVALVVGLFPGLLLGFTDKVGF